MHETGATLGAEDEWSLEDVRDPRKVELLKRDGQLIGSCARHYYDLFQLAGRPKMVAMLQWLQSPELRPH